MSLSQVTVASEFEPRCVWETGLKHRGLLGLPLLGMGQISPLAGCNFSRLISLPGTLFIHTFSIHSLPPPCIPTFTQEAQFPPPRPLPPFPSPPSSFPGMWERLGGGWEAPAQSQLSAPPTPASGQVLCGPAGLPSSLHPALRWNPHQLAIRENKKSFSGHHYSTEHFPGRIH